jgi:hypothetical protein
MDKQNIISAEYSYDVHGHKGMIKVVTSDNEYWIPNNAPENTDYQAIQEWIADGGTVIDNGGGE